MIIRQTSGSPARLVASIAPISGSDCARPPRSDSMFRLQAAILQD